MAAAACLVFPVFASLLLTGFLRDILPLHAFSTPSSCQHLMLTFSTPSSCQPLMLPP